jgi:hypothetical protein
MLYALISTISNPVRIVVYCGTVGLAAAVLMMGTAIFVARSPATAKPEFAAQTGFACAKCHVDAKGGGPRNAYGEAFAKNGFKVPGKK